MTWLKFFFRLRPSSVFIVLFGISTGVLGYTYSRLPTKLYDSDKIIYSFLIGSPVILGCLKWINYIVGKEIEAELDTHKTQLDQKFNEKVETKITEFMDQYSEDIGSLKQDIDKLNITPQKRDEIMKRFCNLQLANEKYKSKLKSAEEVAYWLDIKDNQNILQKLAINAICKSNFSINEQYLSEFEKDIKKCIIWLKYSITDREAYLYQPERQTSAMIKFSPDLYRAYKIALIAIKNHIDKEFDNQTELVKEMIEYLINEIQQSSQKIV